MTKIKFERSDSPEESAAGFVLDLDTIPAEEEQEMLKLISDSNFFNLPDKHRNNRDTDKPHYTITVESGQAHHTLHMTEETAPPALRSLLKALNRILERAKKTPV